MMNSKLSVVFFLFGMMISYIGFDLYSQNKTDKSVLQIAKLLASYKQSNKDEARDNNKSKTTYLLYINGVEHNFSFEDFNIKGLEFNDHLLDKIVVPIATVRDKS